MDYEHLLDLMAKWGGVIAAVVFIARIVVKLTPTPADDTWLQTIVDLLKHIGLQIPGSTDKITTPAPAPPSQPPVGIGNTSIGSNKYPETKP